MGPTRAPDGVLHGSYMANPFGPHVFFFVFCCFFFLFFFFCNRDPNGIHKGKPFGSHIGTYKKGFCSICACLDLSVSSSSWGLGRAAFCDCGTPWIFLLPFFFIWEPVVLPSNIVKTFVFQK